MNRKSSVDYTVVAFTISIVLAIAVSVYVCKLVFGAVTLWAVIGAAALFGLVGGGQATLFEGIVITVIGGILTAIAILIMNIPPFLSQMLLSACIGCCICSLVVGTYKEFFRPSKVWDDPPG
jgi:hypothetical protein